MVKPLASPVAVGLLMLGVLPGAQTPAPPTQPGAPTFRARSELVVMHVTVRDRAGRYVSGLDRESFTVIDDGRPQTLNLFSSDPVPASIAFLIDNSNSMVPNRERVAAAAAAFAARSHPQDEIAILTFNEEVRRVFGPAPIANVPPQTFQALLSRAITASGMSAVYDGILAGLRQVAAGAHTRQVLIVVSDGDDNASTATLEAVRQQVHDSDATIYAVVLADTLLRAGNPKALRRLATETGGESYQPRHVQDIAAVFERIARDIRSAYTLAYTPDDAEVADSTSGLARAARRTVRVYAHGPGGRALRVRARDGYFARLAGEPRP